MPTLGDPMTGWYLHIKGQSVPASLRSFEAHLKHWQIESITEDEIVFNNEFWWDLPVRNNPLHPAYIGALSGEPERRRFRRIK